MEQQGVRLLRRREVEKIVGLTRSTIYRHMEQGDFPRPVALTPRSVRWRSDEVAKWVESRPRSEAQ